MYRMFQQVLNGELKMTHFRILKFFVKKLVKLKKDLSCLAGMSTNFHEFLQFLLKSENIKTCKIIIFEFFAKKVYQIEEVKET